MPTKGPRVTGAEAAIIAALAISLFMFVYATYLVTIGVLGTAYGLYAGVVVIWGLAFAFTAHTRAQRRRKY